MMRSGWEQTARRPRITRPPGLRRSCVMSVSSEADPEGDKGSAWLNRPGMPGDARLVRASTDLSVWGAAEAGSQPCPTFAYRFVEPVGLPSADGPGDRTERKGGCCWRALSQLVCIR
jgi:hypothetical protein